MRYFNNPDLKDLETQLVQSGKEVVKSGFSKQRHQFFTLRKIVDAELYNKLLQARANSINKSVAELQSSQFFPAYRAS